MSRKSVEDMLHDSLLAMANRQPQQRFSDQAASSMPAPELRHMGESDIAMASIPTYFCPECGYQYSMTSDPDGVNYTFTHGGSPYNPDSCSRSYTTFKRPKAQFTVFI